MKKIVLVFAFLLTISFQINAQWFWQNPLPQGNTLTDVCFIDINTGWAIGQEGTMLKTTDGGQNWIHQYTGIQYYLNSVFFLDANIGWAAGDQGIILRTTNGGTTWNLQASRTSNYFLSVYFSDANNGWIVGANGTILHTTNGGVTFFDDEENNFA